VLCVLRVASVRTVQPTIGPGILTDVMGEASITRFDASEVRWRCSKGASVRNIDRLLAEYLDTCTVSHLGEQGIAPRLLHPQLQGRFIRMEADSGCGFRAVAAALAIVGPLFAAQVFTTAGAWRSNIDILTTSAKLAQIYGVAPSKLLRTTVEVDRFMLD